MGTRASLSFLYIAPTTRAAKGPHQTCKTRNTLFTETGWLQPAPSATQSGKLWLCRDRWDFPRGWRGFPELGGTRDALEGLNRLHFRFSSLIAISEGQVYAKWGAGADRGPYGSGKEAIREAYRGVAGRARSDPGVPWPP